jgi:hypothetical protein
MLANALLLSTVVMTVFLFGVAGAGDYLGPYRWVILRRYGWEIALFLTTAFVNMTALFYVAGRLLFLKDTGRKLAHVEKQLRTRSTIAQELSDRLES